MTRKRVLVCAPRLPEYDRERGSQRTLELIEFLQEAGWAVSLIAKNAAGERYMQMLQQRGVATYGGFNSGTDYLIACSDFDLAILSFWDIAQLYMPSIREASPATRILIDTVDVHFLRHARQKFRRPAHNGTAAQLDAAYASDMVWELNTYAAADAVLAVSQKEADLINDLIGDPTLAFSIPLSEELDLCNKPFAERQGILFVGNFRHPPNIEAVEYLCQDVLPRLDPALLAEHPAYVVGNDLPESVRRCGRALAPVRMIGWVPSLLPYFERARISVVPLLNGAGTKGKLIQALMIGTPTVSTSIGIEGLNLRPGEHVLVADDPAAFAEAITRLVSDATLWQTLARQGRNQIVCEHGRDAVRERFINLVQAVMARTPKGALPTETAPAPARQRLDRHQYRLLTRRIQQVVQDTLPPDSTVVVVSRGDSDLLKLDGRAAWHFPQTAGGVYAGHHPADSGDAIAHLEAVRNRGGDFLLFPKTAFWWLDHYVEFKQHLETRYRRIVCQEDACIIFDLREPGAGVLPARQVPMARALG